ncbi:bifunctional DNA primase/polymerase [Trichormus sp. NMC-1]|uniref:bifunctional DNA primase/polymerase n=1 Tax=Trichormus sp. NMC-1 TaxID=1853259 RepID=UPI0031BB2081
MIPTQGKRPLGYQWEQHPWSPQTLLNELQQYEKVPVRNRHHGFYKVTPTGIGVLCGQNSQEFLIAIDCDGYSAQAAIIAHQPLPTTVAFTSGRPGRAQYLLKLPGNTHLKLKSRKITTAPGEVLEFRGTKLPSILPPSIHPQTGYYRWLSGCRPDQIEIAIAPSWIIEQMTKRAKSPKRDYCKHSNSLPTNPEFTGEDTETALLLLEIIHPRFADKYDSWIKVGMALKSVNPTLFSAWEEWSQLSAKYTPGECEYKWQSFRKWGMNMQILHRLANLS